jgi:hypothetical protein
MESIYERASTVGLRVFLGEQVNPVRKEWGFDPILNKELMLYIFTIPSGVAHMFWYICKIVHSH